MRRDDLLRKTRQDLLEIARALGVKGRNAMNKDVLVDTIVSVAPGQDASDKKPADTAAPASDKPQQKRTPPSRDRADSGAARPPRTVASAPPPDETQDDEQNWNSVALGRDPNYGRFLHPGSVSPARDNSRPGPNRVRSVGPTRAESLAERSERGRLRASGGPQGTQRDDSRRSVDRYGGVSSRGQGSTRRPDRIERGPRRGYRDPVGGSRYDRGGRDYRGYDPDYQRGSRGRGMPAGRSSPGRGAHPQGEYPRLASSQQQIPDAADVTVEKLGAADTEVLNGAGASVPGNDATFSPGALPESYGVDRCRLMVRDPKTLHVYWEIGEQAEERAHREFGEDWSDHQRVLRVHGFPVKKAPTVTPAGFFDMEIQPDSTSAYIEVPETDRGYRVDIGLINKQSLFFPMASSNAVISPNNGESRVSEETWMSVPPSETGVRFGEGPSADEVTLDDDEHTRLAPPPVVQAAESDGPEISQKQDPDRDEVPSAPSSAGRVVDWAAPSGRPVQPGLAEESVGPEVAPGSAQAAGEGRAAKAKGRRKKRDFRFELNTELIVYGSTEPDARVTIQGESVELRSDGTFTVRFLLPDGTQTIEVTARSADGLARRVITPIVSRATRHETGDA